MTCFKTLKITTLACAALTLAACVTETRYDWVQVPNPVPAKRAAAPTPAPAPAPAPAPTVDLAQDFIAWAGDRIYFDTDQSALRPEAKDTLDRQADWLRRHPDTQARIEGNADERGSTDYNQALGSRRAEAARAYLVDHGIAASRVSTASNGKAQPIDSGSGPDALARNRNARTIVIVAGK